MGDRIREKTDEEKTWKNTGTVMAANKQNRTYTIKLDSGKFIKRNRKHLLFIRGKNDAFQEKRNERKQYPFKNKEQSLRTTKGRLTQRPQYLKDFV